MAITAYISKKLSVLSFVAIYLVLIIHTAMPQAKEFVYFDFFQRFCGDYICRLYLPLFMMISGYLFYQNIITPNKRTWLDKYKSRFNSLFIPYIIWNVLFIVQMAILQYNPITSGWITTGISPFISSDSIIHSLWIIFTNPANSPLWFIRNLMIIVVFTPVLYFIIKQNKFIILLYIVILMLINTQLTFCLLFFSLGGILSVKNINIDFRIKNIWVWLLIVISILIGILLTIKGEITHLNFYLSIIPLLALWFGYDVLYLNRGKFEFIKRYLPYTFFIYVFHEPSLNIFKKIILKITENSEISFWIAYFLSPILMVLLSYVIGSFIEKATPKMYSIVIGNRKKY